MAENVPDGHEMQVELDVALVVAEYVPPLHCVQNVDWGKVEYVPAMQERQIALDVPPDVVEYLPAAHAVQFDDPEEEYVATGHV